MSKLLGMCLCSQAKTSPIVRIVSENICVNMSTALPAGRGGLSACSRCALSQHHSSSARLSHPVPASSAP